MLGSLFCDRAAAAQRGFALAPETVPAVVDICRRLDGIPLAIELAAARVGVPTPGQIAARLDDWFRLLAHTDSLAGDRQRTLIGALDWSHDLLPLRERILLRRLSVFMGGCTFEAIEAVRGDDGDGEGILDPLAALVAKALVVTDMAGSAARYRLLETVRAYGAQHLREAGEESVVPWP